MDTQRWRLDLTNFKLARMIAPLVIVVIGAATAPVSAQVVTIENRGFGTVYRTPANNSIIYNNPIPTSVNNSIIYGSPIPSPAITYPSSFYSYPSYDDPNAVTRSRRTTLTSPVLVNPTIRDSTLINPTIIIQPQRRDRLIERNTTILRPINY